MHFYYKESLLKGLVICYTLHKCSGNVVPFAVSLLDTEVEFGQYVLWLEVRDHFCALFVYVSIYY